MIDEERLLQNAQPKWESEYNVEDLNYRTFQVPGINIEYE